MTEDTKTSETFEFKAEIQQLLNILVHSLYTEREIFMRELISNAADALNRLQFEMLTDRDVLEPDAELRIDVTVDQDAKKILISDTGIGMTHEEIVRDLGTIAHSGAAAFFKQLEEQKRPAVDLIGQFGVGFYSVFMVAQEVRVVSRSYQPDAEAVEWISDGGTRYEVVPSDKQDRGTRVEIQLKEDAAEFANAWRLEQIIKKHSDFVSFPIYVGDKEEAVNRRTAIWRKAPQEVGEQEYAEFYKHLTLDPEKPLLHALLVTDAPVNVRSVLYVPSRRERGFLSLRTDHGLRLYVHNVMIQEYNKDLLPNYFRFVDGVVESEDLPLNISREAIQSSPAARRIQRALARKLVKELETLAGEQPETYATFWREFGPYLKEGVASEPASHKDLLPLLRFHSSHSGEDMISLDDYVQAMDDDQQAIYYVLGDDLRSVAKSPHLDYFRAHDVQVLYLVDPIDSFLAVALKEYEGKPLKNIDDAGLELPRREKEQEEPAPAVPEADFNRLIGRFVKILGDRVLEVRESQVLRDSPCRLVSSGDAPMREMSRVYRMLDQDFEIPKRILEINRRHPIIVNLAHLLTTAPDAEVIDPTIELLFENQLLFEGLHPNPTEMVGLIEQLMETATGAGQERSQEGA
jgi:molecular chaperone HtpG